MSEEGSGTDDAQTPGNPYGSPQRASGRPTFRGEQRASESGLNNSEPSAPRTPRTRAERRAMEQAARAGGRGDVEDTFASDQPGQRDARTHTGNRNLLTTDSSKAADDESRGAASTSDNEYFAASSTDSEDAMDRSADRRDASDDEYPTRRSLRRNPRHALRSHESSTPRPDPDQVAAQPNSSGRHSAGARKADDATADARKAGDASADSPKAGARNAGARKAGTRKAGAAGAGAAGAGAAAGAASAKSTRAGMRAKAAGAGVTSAAAGTGSAAAGAAGSRRSASSSPSTGASARGTSDDANVLTTASAARRKSSSKARSAQESTQERRDSRHGDGDEDPSVFHGKANKPNGRFPGLVGWTTLGTLVPGLGILHKTKKNPWGWILFIGFIATIGALLVWAIIKGPTRAVAGVAGSPTDLNILAIILPILAVIYIFNILLSYATLRKGRVLTFSRKALGSVLVGSLILIAAIPMGVGSYYSHLTANTLSDVFGDIGSGPIKDKESLFADKDRINVFLMGRDSSDTREGTRPDTMMVASIDTNTGNTTLLSIPRNLAFPVFPKGSKLAKRFPKGFDPGGHDSSTDLINAVWDWIDGEKDKWKGQDTDGMPLGQWATMQAVEGSTGLQMDYWASVNMAGFEDVVNAIGGVKINVERPVPIGGGHNQATGGIYPVKGWINPGNQTLRGSKALWYVRSRWLSDNYDRMCRQQRMIKTVVGQIDPQTITVSYPKLLKAAGNNLKTDIPRSDLPAFIELAAAMQSGKIKSAQINNDVIKTYNPDYPKLKKWITKQVDPKAASQQEEVEGVDSSDNYSKSTAAAKDSAADSADKDSADSSEAKSTELATAKTKKKSKDKHATDGLEDAEGKCYPSSSGRPKGYDWKQDGWPGNSSK